MKRSGAGRAQLLAIAAGLLVFTIVQVALAGGSDSSPQAGKSASLRKQVNQLKARVAALETKPDQVGPTPTIPTTLPPSGTAGGELAGTYPNPTVGTVAGLDVASSTGVNAGINFGTDVDLYRSAADQLTLGAADTLNVSQLSVNNGATLNPGYLNMGENTGVVLNFFANNALLYAVDNGSGKTQLRVKWPDQSEEVLATQP